MFSRDSSLMTSSVTVLVLPSVIVLLISRVTVSSETVFFSCPSALTSVLLTCSVKDSVRVSVNGFGISLLPQFLRNLIWGSLHAPAVFFLASAIVMAPLSEIKRGLFLTPKAINSESPISFFPHCIRRIEIYQIKKQRVLELLKNFYLYSMISIL